MTDNEIIKTLTDVIRLAEHGDRFSADVSLDILKDILNFINRKKAKIKKLEQAEEKLEQAEENLIREVKAAHRSIKQLKLDKEIYKKAFETARRNSIKEFAEKIKDEWHNNEFYTLDADFDDFIDNLIKRNYGSEINGLSEENS